MYVLFITHTTTCNIINNFDKNHTMIVDISNEEYHSDTKRISKSGLDLIEKAPAKYYAAYLDPNAPPRKESNTFDLGSLVHSLSLEPEKFTSEYAIVPKVDRRTISGKAAWEQFQEISEGKKIIDQNIYKQGVSMRDSVMRHPAARKLLLENQGVAEQTFFFEDQYTGAPCKIRTDKYLPKINTIIDIKTTEDASNKGFSRSVFKYNYTKQGAFYKDGILAATGQMVDNFIFIAVEKTYPFLVGVYYMNLEQFAHGRQQYIRDLAIYNECRRTGNWYGYSEKIEELEFYINK